MFKHTKSHLEKASECHFRRRLHQLTKLTFSPLAWRNIRIFFSDENRAEKEKKMNLHVISSPRMRRFFLVFIIVCFFYSKVSSNCIWNTKIVDSNFKQILPNHYLSKYSIVYSNWCSLLTKKLHFVQHKISNILI